MPLPRAAEDYTFHNHYYPRSCTYMSKTPASIE